MRLMSHLREYKARDETTYKMCTVLKLLISGYAIFQDRDECIQTQDRQILDTTSQIHQQFNEIVVKDEQIQHLLTNLQELRTHMEVHT